MRRMGCIVGVLGLGVMMSMGAMVSDAEAAPPAKSAGGGTQTAQAAPMTPLPVQPSPPQGGSSRGLDRPAAPMTPLPVQPRPIQPSATSGANRPAGQMVPLAVQPSPVVVESPQASPAPVTFPAGPAVVAPPPGAGVAGVPAGPQAAPPPMMLAPARPASAAAPVAPPTATPVVPPIAAPVASPAAAPVVPAVAKPSAPPAAAPVPPPAKAAVAAPAPVAVPPAVVQPEPPIEPVALSAPAPVAAPPGREQDEVIYLDAPGTRLSLGDAGAYDYNDSWSGGYEWPGISLGPKFGTTGVGLDLTLGLTRFLNLRGGFNYGSFSASPKWGSVTYDAEVDMINFPLLVDLYPFGGHFRISGGVFFHSDSKVTFDAHPHKPVQIGNHTYAPEVVGTMYGKIKVEDSVVPYVGIGVGNTVGRNRRLTFSLDLGAIIQSYEVTLTSDGPGMKTKLDTFRKDIVREEARLQKDVDKLKVFPVLTLGLGIHF